MSREEHVLSADDAFLAYRASSSIEARSLAAYLDEAGVEAHVLGEALQGGYGGINVGSMNSVEVWVPGSQRPTAESLVATWRQEVAAATGAGDEDDKQNQGRARRRTSFQYSMATALVVMTLTAIFAALVGQGVLSWYEAPGFVFSVFYAALIIALAIKYFRYLRGSGK